ncbi:hypothetical protein B0O80DRAFT_460645 [Mortierella sp. GBAus27b]|nr:hypothetical protein B0O80DRAFT_460645 [Mortierella sp. GBAus27b]
MAAQCHSSIPDLVLSSPSPPLPAKPFALEDSVSPRTSTSSATPSPSTSSSTTDLTDTTITNNPNDDLSYDYDNDNAFQNNSTTLPPIAETPTPATETIEEEPRKTQAPPKQRSKSGYVARVGFDSLDCEDTAEYVFTLQARTDHWRRTSSTRSFLVCTDLNEYSCHALQWVMSNMVEDGDEVIALRVVPMELRDSFAKYGIPSFQGQEIAARSEATKIMEMIRESNKGKEINIIVECLVGNVKDTIMHMIRMYEPSMLVVGTRGRNSVKGLLLGSLSRYFLNHSPIPVTVVRPASKRIKSKSKSKGIFRRRSSAIASDLEEEDLSPPSFFYSSPLSRETTRSSNEYDDLPSSKAEATGLGERGPTSPISFKMSMDLERKESRSPEPTMYTPTTAAAKASAAKRASLFPTISTPISSSQSSLHSPSSGGPSTFAQQQSISSSLSFASAMLASSPPRPPGSQGSGKSSIPPEVLRLTKSLTTDGTTLPGASSVSKKISHRLSLAKLSGSIFSPLSRKKSTQA